MYKLYDIKISYLFSIMKQMKVNILLNNDLIIYDTPTLYTSIVLFLLKSSSLLLHITR